MPSTSDIIIKFSENPAIFGELANAAAHHLSVLSFSEFQHLRAEQPFPPQKPVLALYEGSNEKKRQVFDLVNHEIKLAHNKAMIRFQNEKKQYDVLNGYPDSWAGYGRYLLDKFPHVSQFLGIEHPISIDENSRRLHTYITGGTGSGKSECIKSLIWHYLTKDTSSAVVYIDPHNDLALQVAQFWPNRNNERLVYIQPKFNDVNFPGLNPFDIENKENLTDIEAEAYASEFIWAFHELLDGTLSDQMMTVLKCTLPVLIKMPNTSVHDLIQFLTPRMKTPKGKLGSGNVPEYSATKYVAFALQHFKNKVMLDFLEGQFENDIGYISTRNSLTTRLTGMFGSTLMQALFYGRRTIRFEELIPQKKLMVFNLADLQEQTAIIGRFILISLKIFALNQAKVAKEKRTPCHVFVDECQNFVTESMTEILQEARKFSVFLTLAQQSAGANMSAKLFEAVRTNFGIKMAGVNSGGSVDIMAKETGVPSETIANFNSGQFAVFQRQAKLKVAIVRMPTNTLHNTASMDNADWQKILGTQIRCYYQTANAPTIQYAKGEESRNDLLNDDISRFHN